LRLYRLLLKFSPPRRLPLDLYREEHLVEFQPGAESGPDDASSPLEGLVRPGQCCMEGYFGKLPLAFFDKSWALHPGPFSLVSFERMSSFLVSDKGG